MRLSAATARCNVASAATPRRAMHVTCFMSKNEDRQQASLSAKVLVTKKPSSPPQLVKEEEASLQTALQAAGLPASASATELPQNAVQGLLTTISRGVVKQEQDLVKLEGAMLLAESLFHAGGGNLGAVGGTAGPSPQTVDVWQPVFASAGGFPRLLYIPVPEYFDMHRAMPDAVAISISSVNDSIDVSSSPDRVAAAAGAGGRINIITELGPLTTHFLGSCNWINDTTFEYSINTLRLDLGGRSISFGLGPFKLENQLSFFLTTPQLACARSKLGGTMLLAAGPSQGEKYFNAW